MSQFRPINTAICLENICESNYHKLFKLIPNLCSIDRLAIGQTANNPALYLSILERNPYTLTIELNHCFSAEFDRLIDPGLRIRIYLDAQLAEVIRDNQHPTVAQRYKNPGLIEDIRDYKWRLNYFLQKWLDHCLGINYHFKQLLTESQV
jgi:uncharacterized protein YqiB (DUF1249 family)